MNQRNAALGLVALLVSPMGLAAQERLCSAANDHLGDAQSMATVVEADTIDDWRTDQMVPGCRITAAGLTRIGLPGQARAFYDELQAAGWTRTPKPQDAPNEASLRFRKDGSDCLFNFYSDGLLGTDAEFEVDDARVPAQGEKRYNFLVLCTPAVDVPSP